MTTRIGAPTQQGLQEYQQSDVVNPADPRSLSVAPGTTALMDEVVATTAVLPSRVTGQAVTDETFIGETPEGYTGVDLGYISDFVRGANDLILALPDLAIDGIASGLEAAGIVEPNTVD